MPCQQLPSPGHPSYDANGDVANDCLHTYTWNSYGRPLTIDSVGLTYDALGRMVEQNRSGAYTQMVYAPTGFKMQIMSGPSLVKNFVPLPGGGLAVYDCCSLAYIGHSDHLGSLRFASTTSRTMYFDTAYAPFGETYASSGSSDPAFTGQRQDTVSGVYDFPAREYSFTGRWLSPDPAGLAAVNLTNPQSWNRYAYVLNDPANFTDPSGMVCSGNAGPAIGDTPCNTANSGGGGGSGSFGGYNPFDLLYLALTPTGITRNPDFWDNFDSCWLGDCPDTPAFLEVYGNWGLLSLLGGSFSRMDQSLHSGITRVFQALQNPGCRGLFGSDYDPGALLMSLEFRGNIQTAGFGNPGEAAHTEPVLINNQGQSAFSQDAVITVNSTGPYFNGFKSFLGYDNADNQVGMFVHELGHAAWYVYGANSSGIFPDVSYPPSLTAYSINLNNSSRALAACTVP